MAAYRSRRGLVAVLALAGALVLSGCSEEKKKQRKAPPQPHPASLIEGCDVPPPSHGPKKFSASLARDISGLSQAWGLVMMANPNDGLTGKLLEERVAEQVQQLLADVNASTEETVYAGKIVPAVSMKITPPRMLLIESLPYVCTVVDDRGYWPTE